MPFRAALSASEAASSSRPDSSRYRGSLRPCPATPIAPRRRAPFPPNPPGSRRGRRHSKGARGSQGAGDRAPAPRPVPVPSRSPPRCKDPIRAADHHGPCRSSPHRPVLAHARGAGFHVAALLRRRMARRRAVVDLAAARSAPQATALPRRPAGFTTLAFLDETTRRSPTSSRPTPTPSRRRRAGGSRSTGRTPPQKPPASASPPSPRRAVSTSATSRSTSTPWRRARKRRGASPEWPTPSASERPVAGAFAGYRCFGRSRLPEPRVGRYGATPGTRRPSTCSRLRGRSAPQRHVGDDAPAQPPRRPGRRSRATGCPPARTTRGASGRARRSSSSTTSSSRASRVQRTDAAAPDRRVGHAPGARRCLASTPPVFKAVFPARRWVWKERGRP